MKKIAHVLSAGILAIVLVACSNEEEPVLEEQADAAEGTEEVQDDNQKENDNVNEVEAEVVNEEVDEYHVSNFGETRLEVHPDLGVEIDVLEDYRFVIEDNTFVVSSQYAMLRISNVPERWEDNIESYENQMTSTRPFLNKRETEEIIISDLAESATFYYSGVDGNREMYILNTVKEFGAYYNVTLTFPEGEFEEHGLPMLAILNSLHVPEDSLQASFEDFDGEEYLQRLEEENKRLMEEQVDPWETQGELPDEE
ncbi:hypothetical protein FLK61_37100 [Paenalkalicoccus suaedae]|uniref:Uncharacterized protein n=1 Tax=Paenalkalicoccus suaedae TaxID=2592382 RepID=A0A859FIV4_9BACI|nr:hypothetical protein [Paenalkalicoccus suaedae]QKS72256.1 hypothetical protein FLK61_37100 [Paenalkalicoccus suaedae]